MKASLKFFGAHDTVTGSKTLLTHEGKRYLVDCGLFQGDKTLRQRNWQGFPFEPRDLACVFLTHAHLDHSGMLPRLVKDGFKGPIFCSTGTADLCRILLADAAHLEEESANYANRTGYSNHEPALPLFTSEDAARAIELLVPLARGDWHRGNADIEMRFLRAGHIVGASMVELRLKEGKEQRTIVFSGDLGHERSITMRGPENLPACDMLILESTYGGRPHAKVDPLFELAKVVTRTAERGGVLVIPAFAVGRAQELTHMLRVLEDRKAIPEVPVILDSPMAIDATEIFLRHPGDHRLGEHIRNGSSRLYPCNFEMSRRADESMLVTMRDGPMVVISASGMLSGGRILHHLKIRLPDQRNTVLFCGYQAEGTKGRFLQDNAGKLATLRIHHQEIPVNAEIVTLPALSAHGDSADLVMWLKYANKLPRKIIVNHGSVNAQEAMRDSVRSAFPNTAVACAKDTPGEVLIDEDL